MQRALAIGVPHSPGLCNGRNLSPEPHGMGLRISRDIHPKCRRRTLYGQLHQHLGEVFRKRAAPEGKRARGRALDARPRAHDDRDPA